MIQLIMVKIKSKCKINLSRCRGGSQIDAPSVGAAAAEICSPEWSCCGGGASRNTGGEDEEEKEGHVRRLVSLKKISVKPERKK